MSDGRHAVSGSSDRTFQVWDMEGGRCLVVIAHSAPITIVKSVFKGNMIIFEDSLGNLSFLSIHNVKTGTPFANPVCLWLYGSGGNKRLWFFRRGITKGKWDDNITALCEWCGKRIVVSGEILDVIRSINRNARLSPDDSPCLKLPREAWDDPRLLSQCPHCHQPLKFNPFVVDNRERY